MTPRRVLVAIALVIGGLIAALAAGLIPRLWNMKAEYVTAGVIRDTEEYVVRSQGRWPQSWADLGEDRSRYTTIDFAAFDSTFCRTAHRTFINPAFL